MSTANRWGRAACAVATAPEPRHRSARPRV